MAKPIPLRARLSYSFDNFMSKGLWAKIGLLALVTIVFILLMGIVASIAYGDAGQMAPWVWWKTVMTSLGKSTPGQDDGSPVFVALMLIAMIYGMFFTSILIGFISGAIREKVNNLAKGGGAVAEDGHIIILGFNEETFVLLEELIEASRNQRRPQTVVVLAETPKERMDDEIHARFGSTSNHPKLRIVTRTGSTCDLASLERCSIGSCRSIIVSGTDDFESTKSIMACTYQLNSEDVPPETYAVAEIHEEGNVDAASIAGRDGREGDRLELLPLQEILARIIVHTSRQPGLSKVYIELFNFVGNEFYTIQDDPAIRELIGLDIRRINLRLKDAVTVGVHDPQRGVILGDPNQVVLEEGCSLIVIARDDDALQLLPEALQPADCASNERHEPETLRCLVLGGQPILNDMAIEYARYLQPGSSVLAVAEEGSRCRGLGRRAGNILGKASISFEMRTVPEFDKETLFAVLDEFKPHSVVLLDDHSGASPQNEDARTISLLLYLRDYRESSGREFGITSEMRLGKNREIASATSP
ncbi:MAG: hypothetical protein IJH83_08040, partial [Coriobacteriales bacterium]|nr:hypothetical protein [Coriobacteriales bacterium]